MAAFKVFSNHLAEHINSKDFSVRFGFMAPLRARLTFLLSSLTVMAVLLPLAMTFNQAPSYAVGFAEGEPVLVVLTATWCAKCRDLDEIITPTLETYAQKNIRTVLLDVDNPSTTEVSGRYGISLSGNDIPQIYLYSGGKTLLLMSSNDYVMGHTEEAQAALEKKLAPLL